MNFYETLKKNLKESESGELNVNKIAAFIEQAINDLQTSDYTCSKYDLDDDLAIYVGWSEGYGDEPRDDVIQSEKNPDYGLNVGIKVRNDYDWTDFDYLNFPVYNDDSGEIWDAAKSIRPNDDYKKTAKWLVDEYKDIKKAVKKGEVILESCKSTAVKETETYVDVPDEEKDFMVDMVWNRISEYADPEEYFLDKLTDEDVAKISEDLMHLWINHRFEQSDIDDIMESYAYQKYGKDNVVNESEDEEEVYLVYEYSGDNSDNIQNKKDFKSKEEALRYMKSRINSLPDNTYITSLDNNKTTIATVRKTNNNDFSYTGSREDIKTLQEAEEEEEENAVLKTFMNKYKPLYDTKPVMKGDTLYADQVSFRGSGIPKRVEAELRPDNTMEVGNEEWGFKYDGSAIDENSMENMSQYWFYDDYRSNEDTKAKIDKAAKSLYDDMVKLRASFGYTPEVKEETPTDSTGDKYTLDLSVNGRKIKSSELTKEEIKDIINYISSKEPGVFD